MSTPVKIKKAPAKRRVCKHPSRIFRAKCRNCPRRAR